jgi:hypothetical protein
MKTKSKNKKTENKITFTQLIKAKKAYENAEKIKNELEREYREIVCGSTHLSNKICSIGRKKYYVTIDVQKNLYGGRFPEIKFLPVSE